MDSNVIFLAFGNFFTFEIMHNISLVVHINNLNLLKKDNEIVVFFNLERIEKLNESRGLTKSGQNYDRRE